MESAEWRVECVEWSGRTDRGRVERGEWRLHGVEIGRSGGGAEGVEGDGGSGGMEGAERTVKSREWRV